MANEGMHNTVVILNRPILQFVVIHGESATGGGSGAAFVCHFPPGQPEQVLPAHLRRLHAGPGEDRVDCGELWGRGRREAGQPQPGRDLQRRPCQAPADDDRQASDRLLSGLMIHRNN